MITKHKLGQSINDKHKQHMYKHIEEIKSKMHMPKYFIKKNLQDKIFWE